jgi:hypothetical protein
MPIRLLILAAMLLPLAACFGGGSSDMPVSETVTYDASDTNAAKEAADHCAQYDLKAVPSTSAAKSGTVSFACR